MKQQKANNENLIKSRRTLKVCKPLIGELERLKCVLNAGLALTVEWLPNKSKELCGEVKGNSIYIYDVDIDSALMTLRHEFLDYVICQAIEPYKKVTNKLIELLNEEAYIRKEKLVEVLAKAI